MADPPTAAANLAIGRVNWLFTGSQFGGETAAAWFSVVASARLHEGEP